MMKSRDLQRLIDVIREVFEPDLKPLFGMQTNAVLLTNEHIALMNRENFQIGVSCDGPPAVNDLFRVNHNGRGSGNKVESSLHRLSGQPCFKSLLCVINVDSDPLTVFEYLAQFQPKAIDFLLPHGTYDSPPPRKGQFDSTPYADWLIPIFDRWFLNSSGTIQIRIFEELMQNLCGGMGSLESLGLRPVTLLVVAPDGSFEGVDTLKVVGPGAQVLGYNSIQHSLDEVSTHPKVTMRQLGETGLCTICSSCNRRQVCGGGYLPHRYSSHNGFGNPSIYCRDLYKLIQHIEKAMRQCFAALKPAHSN
jgi:uncharacterized protein